jgi:hypothetical protein
MAIRTMFWRQRRGRRYNRRSALLIGPSPYRAFTDTLLGCAADIISTVEFDSTGNYLATGDKGGRVVLFERNESVRQPSCALLMVAVIDLSIYAHCRFSIRCATEKGMRV